MVILLRQSTNGSGSGSFPNSALAQLQGNDVLMCQGAMGVQHVLAQCPRPPTKLAWPRPTSANPRRKSLLRIPALWLCSRRAHSSDQKQGSDVISRLTVTFCREERVFCVLIRVVSNTVNIASCSHLLVLQLLAALHEVAPATMSKHSSSETERWPATSLELLGSSSETLTCPAESASTPRHVDNDSLPHVRDPTCWVLWLVVFE